MIDDRHLDNKLTSLIFYLLSFRLKSVLSTFYSFLSQYVNELFL